MCRVGLGAGRAAGDLPLGDLAHLANLVAQALPPERRGLRKHCMHRTLCPEYGKQNRGLGAWIRFLFTACVALWWH